MGTLAVHITANDLASSGAEPVGILTCVILPPRTREKKLHDLMEEIILAANRLHIEVMGGHTEISDVVNRPVITVTGVGKVKKDKLVSTGGLRPDDDLVMTKWAGLEGTSIIAEEKREDLLTRIPEQIIDAAAAMRLYFGGTGGCSRGKCRCHSNARRYRGWHIRCIVGSRRGIRRGDHR